MPYKPQANFEPMRSEDTFGATYTAIGDPLDNPAVLVGFKNLTNGDVLVSTNGTADNFAFPAAAHDLYASQANCPNKADQFMFPKGTQFYVKDGPTPSSAGTFYIEVLPAVFIPA